MQEVQHRVESFMIDTIKGTANLSAVDDLEGTMAPNPDQMNDRLNQDNFKAIELQEDMWMFICYLKVKQLSQDLVEKLEDGTNGKVKVKQRKITWWEYFKSLASLISPIPFRGQNVSMFRIMMAMILIQEACLGVIVYEGTFEFYYYIIRDPIYILLRYFFVIAIYFMFAKDWKAISQMFLIRRVYDVNIDWQIGLRMFCVFLNELIMFSIVCCSNIGENRGLGLVKDFSAVLIICEFDDLVMQLGRIHRIKENIEKENDETEEEPPNPDRPYAKLNDRKYAHKGFLQLNVPKEEGVGRSWFYQNSFVNKINNAFCCCCRFFSMDYNAQTMHRIFLMGVLLFMMCKDSIGTNDFNNAVEEGGTLAASSSWLPDYPVENALLYKDENDSTQYYQTSWCAHTNQTGEWIQVQVPQTEYWNRIVISGNVVLNAYVTQLEIWIKYQQEWRLAEDKPFKVVRDQRGDTEVTYYLNKVKNYPSKLIRIFPKAWVGPKPCLRFEAYYY
ncbi:hypothetical protein FGO68_gene5957 [Halteria grandinella]|uniref:F5/8 type C domain-containing protein n=1 Tax=Halteria grandinella TaxID=5974 RepID=A0A8J8NVM6_HALGN|nr:hypothetical protein FGO68_gene5957 [Halteria grandinella]